MKTTMNISRFACLASCILVLMACDPMIDDDISLGPLPDAPVFSVEMVPGDSNRVVVTDLSTEFFDRLWVLDGGDPVVSKEASDTVFYAKAGTYTIELHASSLTGNGTAVSSQTVTILRDAEVACDDKVSLLTGECGPQARCWTFTDAAGAVSVGPVYGSTEWFSSQEGGLQAEQYDDDFCFLFEDRTFIYDNKGLTIDPWAGFVPVEYDPPAATWSFKEGTGMNGADQIVLSEGAFMGVWNTDNVLDVIVLTEDELIVRTPLIEEDGSIGEGWFELKFVAR